MRNVIFSKREFINTVIPNGLGVHTGYVLSALRDGTF